ncbi:Extracellular Matrix protein PelB [hydrothermal vent metagenome]|uniref:Extracellular Matrix protein PelB n=1 Tax=hydrothermal vent metagenome TaxID=652676 RepID=A0A1W1BTB7_9ZZZZ
MYSSVNNSDKSSSILSLKEIFGVIVVFSLVLYLLFPKKNIDKILEGKTTNSNLSIKYLESMLLYYPNNFKLKMILVENYKHAGKFKKALDLTKEVLAHTKNREKLKELYKSEYLLLKKLYFQDSKNISLDELKKKLYNYFEFTKGERNYTFFFAESTQLDFTKLKYVSLKGFLKERPDMINYDFEKDAFIQALALGYKDEAYTHLLNLIEYTEFEESLYEYALGMLVKHKNYRQAKDLATRIFLTKKSREEKIKYFNMALYFSSKISNNRADISELVELYQIDIDLKSADIAFLLKSLLQVGDIKGASEFALKAFSKYKNEFSSDVTKVAVQSLTYNKQLSWALKLATYAKDRFKTIEWLDKTIQLSLWQGKMKEVVALNIEGYREYGNLKYEHYLLNSCTLNSAYKILGEIYMRNVENRDFSSVKKLSEYFEYTGEINKAEIYFTNLLKKMPHKEIYKEAIRFSYDNSHYKKGLALYAEFQKKYGIDKELHELAVQKLIALKRYKEAYAYAKVLKKDRRFFDLSSLEKDYKYMFKELWKAEKENRLAYSSYYKLIQLEKAFNKGKRVAYLYNTLWKKTKKRVYLTALLYEYLDKNDFKSISKLLKTVSPKDKEHFEKNIYYHIALANYYIKIKNIKSAMNEYKKALAINSKDASTHQAYLWFLLDNELINPLKKELNLLEKNRKLQKQVGFPSVITAFKFQKSDLALRWLKPLLKLSDNIEYQVVYADLLELQDRVEGAKKVRLKLFRRVNKMVKQNPKLLKNKDFARVYLGLVLRYKTPYEKRAKYFKKFKSLFSKKEFLEMKIGLYTHSQNARMVQYIVGKNRINIPWLNLYLAINLGDNYKKQRLLEQYKDILPFRDRVVASLDIGDRAGAYSLAFKGMKDNSRDVELFKIYNNMVNADYPKASFSSNYKHLTPQLSAYKNSLSYRWNIYKGLESKVEFTHYDYKENSNKSLSDSSLAFTLKNSNKKFLWDFRVAKHSSQENFLSASLDLNYNFDTIALGVKSNYNSKTTQTPKLQENGLESSIDLTLRKSLTKRLQLALNYKNSEYTQQDDTDIGQSEQFGLSSDYLLKAGYPDIRFNSYINYNRYDETIKNSLPKDFIELGSQFSIGTSSKNTIHHSWRPFATFGLALNNHHELGTSASFGFSTSLKGADSFSLMFDYSKGVDAISKPYYGLGLGYRF